MNPIDSIIEKYWEGQTTLEEEQRLSTYLLSDQVAQEHQDLVPLFQHFKSESELGIKMEDLDLSFTQAQPTKVRRLLPRMIGIAASLLLIMGITFHYMNDMEDPSYKNTFTEVEDPEEALKIAKEALSYLGTKYNKGSDAMTKSFKSLEKTYIFKFEE